MILFDDMMTDTVSLVKQDGTRKDRIKAIVQSKEIFISDVSLDVEEGDRIERQLPNGKRESFLILDTGFNAGLDEIPPFYQMKVKKESAIVPDPARQSVVYNVTGANARININSTDASTNIASVSPSELFSRMREAVAQAITDEVQRRELNQKIDGLESNHGSSGFARSYADFISSAANHITVFQPFMPALVQLLGA